MEFLIGAVLWSPLYGDTHQNVLYCVPLDAQSPCLSTHVMIIMLSLLGAFDVGFLSELLKGVVLLPLFSETLLGSYIVVYHLQHCSWAPGSAHRY